MAGGKAYEIVNASKNPVREIDVDGHRVKLARNGQGFVHDAGLAEEIDARYGQKARTKTAGKVVVIPIDDGGDRPDTRPSIFSMPDMSRFKRGE